MFDRITTASRGLERINRRQFLYAGFGLIGVGSLLAFFRLPQLSLQSNFYRRALARRDLSGGPIPVYKMVPLPGCKYSKADAPHMANKIFPSLEAARGRRQHKAFFYGLKRIDLARSLVNGMGSDTLFCSRRDLDYRVAKDRRHWRRLGVDMEAVFRVVRNA